ncbi:PGPGW domain-containing protein [Aliikangiella sp. IMCC44653]
MHTRFNWRLKNAKVMLFDWFNSPLGRPVRKLLLTFFGVLITLLGVVLIILPGPAFLLIPIGLALLALEYQFARKWLRQCQRWMTASAKKADESIDRCLSFFRSRKVK